MEKKKSKIWFTKTDPRVIWTSNYTNPHRYNRYKYKYGFESIVLPSAASLIRFIKICSLSQRFVNASAKHCTIARSSIITNNFWSNTKLFLILLCCILKNKRSIIAEVTVQFNHCYDKKKIQQILLYAPLGMRTTAVVLHDSGWRNITSKVSLACWPQLLG